MVQSVSELFQIIRANPSIDGLGYFVEVETESAFADADLDAWTAFMQHHFCEHAQATSEGNQVLGLDFHDHILRSEDQIFMQSMEQMLKEIEARFGIKHLCVEFQFDFAVAKKNQDVLDELLQP